MSFLPDNYQPPESNSNYFKLQKGDNKFRFLTSPIIGWVGWVEAEGKKKPIRAKKKEELPTYASNVKFFWSAVILDHATKSIKVFEITQRTIQAAIEDYYAMEDWGNPLEYDLNIKKKGDGMETEYSIAPSPKKEIDKNYYDEAKKINLNALYEGGDPFKQDVDAEFDPDGLDKMDL